MRAFTSSATRPSDDIPLPPPGAGRDTSKVGAAIKRRSGTVIIGTLNPSKLTPTDHLTTVRYSQHSCQLHVYTPFFPGRVQLVLPQSPRTNQSLSPVSIGGFLYYHLPTRAPPLAGELRFRVTASDDPTDFPSGLDLMTDRGVPWTIPLSVIAKFEKHEPLRHLLTAVDKAVPQQVMDLAAAQEHRQHYNGGHLMGNRYLHAFGQPFDLALDHTYHAFAFVSRNRIAHTQFHYVGWLSAAGVQHAPFLGRAICCFEPSSLPEHSGKRVVVIRVLRSLESDPIRPNPSYTGPEYPPELSPREGELLMNLWFRKVRPWVGDVDGTLGKGQKKTTWPLGLLFENAVEYGSPYSQ
ncbi:hypothetical protein OH76DRAFT_1361551 [Lentinus brumalis]|uniref:Uncharacterized protein n=1 Tax=Lentinus brumalis TaxID=2498619 RepID=A0A371CSD0_9APHY|nr:hypothetical protein OH76DRAFT_1361551 [Polyporus brumalis]